MLDGFSYRRLKKDYIAARKPLRRMRCEKISVGAAF